MAHPQLHWSSRATTTNKERLDSRSLAGPHFLGHHGAHAEGQASQDGRPVALLSPLQIAS